MDAFDVEVSKTKVFAEKIKSLEVVGVGSSLLIVSDEISECLSLSSRNLPCVDVRSVQALDPVALVGSDVVVLTVGAVKKDRGMVGMNSSCEKIFGVLRSPRVSEKELSSSRRFLMSMFLRCRVMLLRLM